MTRRRILASVAALALGAAGTVVALRVLPDAEVAGLRICPPGLERVGAVGRAPLCAHGQDPEARADGSGLCIFGICPLPSTNPPPAYACVGDGLSGDRVQLYYAHTASRSPASGWEASARDTAAKADAFLAARTNQHYRFVCAGGLISVRRVIVADTSLGAFIRAVGEARSDRFYTAFVQGGSGGQGTVNTRESFDPAQHRGPQYSVTVAFQASILVHELGHNLGAVLLSAPHSTGAWHCWDEVDIMCYDDGGSKVPPGGTKTLCSGDERWDCRSDDFWNAGTSPLVARWNTRRSFFLTGGG